MTLGDRPDGTALLAEARRLLLEELLELLPPERRYDARMIANAMAIAGRELEAGDAPLRRAVHELAALFGEVVDPALPMRALEERRTALAAWLAAEIRAGAFDQGGPRREAVRRLLRADVLARLALSNPKALP